MELYFLYVVRSFYSLSKRGFFGVYGSPFHLMDQQKFNTMKTGVCLEVIGIKIQRKKINEKDIYIALEISFKEKSLHLNCSKIKAVSQKDHKNLSKYMQKKRKFLFIPEYLSNIIFHLFKKKNSKIQGLETKRLKRFDF